MNLYPSRSLLRRLAERGMSWPYVEADLNRPDALTPASGYETRHKVCGDRYVGFLEPFDGVVDGWLVIGIKARSVAPEECEEHEPVVGVEPKRSIPRSSGGAGRRWPSTWGELVDRLRKIPGVSVERGGKHLKVRHEGKVIDTLPVSASDHKAIRNAALGLSRKGIDVSRVRSLASGFSFVVILPDLLDYLGGNPFA